jgi:hypothetical protein
VPGSIKKISLSCNPKIEYGVATPFLLAINALFCLVLIYPCHSFQPSKIVLINPSPLVFVLNSDLYPNPSRSMINSLYHSAFS